MYAMIGAPYHAETTFFRRQSVLCFLLCIPVALMLASCALFGPSGVETQGLSAEDRAFYNKYSKKFGICFTGAENKKLIRAIDGWLGAPYRLGGCSKKGVDCSCFVQTLYATVYGIELKRSAREMFDDARLVSGKNLREGDLLFLKGKNKTIFHVGIYLKEGKFVHVSTARGVVISSLQEGYYRKYFHAGGRVATNG